MSASPNSDRLRNLRNFTDLIHYLEDELAWPLQQYGFEELTFAYEAEELGLREEDTAKANAIHQLRPLASGQPWGIFFIEFEKKRLPVVVLRRILSLLVIKKRATAVPPGAAPHPTDPARGSPSPPTAGGEGRGEVGQSAVHNPQLRLPPLSDEPSDTRTISPDEPFVQILDPATGTATFLVEVIDVIHRHLEAKWKRGGLAAMPALPAPGASGPHGASGAVSSGHGGAVPAISRGLSESASDTPGSRAQTKAHPGGVPDTHAPRTPLAPLRGAALSATGSGGVAGAQPPANGLQPSGLPGAAPRTFADYWNLYVPAALLPRLHAFELMMAPYAIAHMKIGLKLAETGYRFGTEERARIYLTNALEPWVKQLPLLGFDALAHEAAAVNEIKRHKRFTVVIGNPPYNNRSENKTAWIMGLIETYKETVRREETQIQALSDDYIKFLRLADWSVAVSGVGTIGMITNNGFLDGHIFRDLRRHFAATFNAVRVVNLHGDSRKKETAPDGKPDKNVFDIMQGVSLTIVARTGKQIGETPILYQDAWGDRQAKYQSLLAGLLKDSWLPIDRAAASKMLVPIRGFSADWDRACPLAECFGTGNWVADKTYAYGSGFKSQQDELAIAFERETLVVNIETLLQPGMTESELRKRFSLCNTNQWSFSRARERLRKWDWRKAIQKVLFRPFDFRYTLITADVVTNPRREIMAQLERPNVALLATRKATEGFSVFATRVPCGHKIVGNYDMTTVFPTYRYPIEGDAELALGSENREVNFAPAFLRQVARALNLSQTKPHGLPAGLTPEDIFHYAYAVFHSPGYRSRYAEFLKIDFPRLPLTGNLELFRALARLGGELTALHLLESPKLDQPITEYLGGRAPEVEKVSWSRNTVWLDKAQTVGFKGVREDVWKFHIGGYQVCEKWLKDRKARTLCAEDIAHYQKIVVALSETIRLMTEIDRVIEAHGGWPLK